MSRCLLVPAVAALLWLPMARPSAHAQGAVLKTLHVFNGSDGKDPASALVQGSDGNFYGTAAAGGASGDGTAFELTPGGAFTKLHDFLAAADGQTPDSSLVEGGDGNFYGQARFGGASQGQPAFGAPSPGFGTVYRVTPDGEFTVLHRYAGEDGAFPVAGMILGGDGDFYGTTSDGGTVPGAGVAFRLSPSGVQTILYTFSVD